MNKLEKMQKIFSITGIKPEKNVDIDENGNLYLTFNSEANRPYYSFEQLWKILPKYIKREESYEAYGCETFYSKNKYYLYLDKKGIGYVGEPGDDSKFLVWYDYIDLLDVALDLVLWCINEGEIQA